MTDANAMSGAADTRAGGVWALAGGQAIIVEPDGPATMLVPGESVLVIAVDLPLASRGKRIEALPFAIEDRISDPIESVHIALGEEIAPRRYLAAVVRHSQMAAWVEAADANGLGHAAMVPDALMLPMPDEGEWNARAEQGRVIVRSSDGTGFAVPALLMRQAWDAAGQPRVWNLGPEPIGDLPQAAGVNAGGTVARPPIDLRQGRYAQRGGGGSGWARRLGWIAAAGVAAHAAIAAADTAMLKVIAERRAADVRSAVAQAAPGANLTGDLRTTVMDMLPAGGPAGSAFVPLVTRTGRALSSVPGITARTMRFEQGTLVLDIEGGEAGLADRARAALRSAGVDAQVAAGQGGVVRVMVRA